MKKLAVSFAAAALTAVTATGCSGRQEETAAETTKKTETTATTEATTAVKTEATETTKEAAEAAAEADEENHNAGDAPKDNTRNRDEIGESKLLIVSFDTNYNNSRRLTIGATENAIEKAFPDFTIGRGLTSQIIIDRVRSRDDAAIDSVSETLDRTEKNGVRNLMIQPTHLMDGFEYTDLVSEVVEYSDAFEKVAIRKPLLTTDGDSRAVVEAIAEATARYGDSETAICFMEHGTEADSSQVYAKVQDMLTETGYKSYHVGTVETAPGLDDVLTAVKEGSYKRVVLEPLMIVTGDHANNDMEGDEEDSRKTISEDAGYRVTCLVNGLGELEAIKQLFVEHAQVAVNSLTK